MEIWDAYNEKGELTGGNLFRGEKIPKGLFHLVVEILVVHQDGSILSMKRDLEKEVYPGKYEASAGGSVLKGETSKQGAFRELFEETGIAVKDLQFIYRRLDNVSIYDQYICKTDCEKDAIVFQEGETIDYKWLPQEEFFEFMMTDDFVDLQRDRYLGMKDELLTSIRRLRQA